MVEPLAIRKEQPPDDTTVVVRAGVMAPETIVVTATDAFDDYGIYMVSVEAALDVSVDELCRTSPRIGERYGRVRTSTFGRLRHESFVLLPTFERPHFDIVLADISEFTIARLIRCFNDPIPNPGRASRG